MIIGYTYKWNLSHSKNSYYQRLFWSSQVAQWQRICLATQESQEPWVLSLDQEDPLEEENGKPLQNSCLKNSMDSRAWRVIVHAVAKNQTRLSTHTHTHPHTHTHTHQRLFSTWSLTPYCRAYCEGADPPLSFTPPQSRLETIWGQWRCYQRSGRELPWWSSGWKSTFQCREHGFNPWLRN